MSKEVKVENFVITVGDNIPLTEQSARDHVDEHGSVMLCFSALLDSKPQTLKHEVPLNLVWTNLVEMTRLAVNAMMDLHILIEGQQDDKNQPVGLLSAEDRTLAPLPSHQVTLIKHKLNQGEHPEPKDVIVDARMVSAYLVASDGSRRRIKEKSEVAKFIAYVRKNTAQQN